jgi:hypothetical protein
VQATLTPKYLGLSRPVGIPKERDNLTDGIAHHLKMSGHGFVCILCGIFPHFAVYTEHMHTDVIKHI